MNAQTLAYPLCDLGDTINNPNGCMSFIGLSGRTYYDNNSNCMYNSTDEFVRNVPIKLYDNTNNLIAQTNSFSNGVYNFQEPAGTYTVKVDTAAMPFIVQCTYPGIDTMVTLTTSNPQLSNVNFDIVCKPGFDVGVHSVIPQGPVFPGQQHRLRIVAGDMNQWYNLNCTGGISGVVSVMITGPVSYVGVINGALTPSVAGNVFTYNIADFGNVNIQTDFGLLFNTDTTAQAGDIVCVTVVVTPTAGDNNTTNNTYTFCYTVANSYDPNMKEVYPVNVQPGYDDWFTYTLHFQNTGNAAAYNIRLRDTLDMNFDLETFRVVGYSHYNTVAVAGNVLTVYFPNIMLPDSTSNEAASHGYIQYRIKPKANLPLGTAIKNTCYIYFDFNDPIATNTTTNLFQLTGINDVSAYQGSILISPNPANQLLNISLSLPVAETVSMMLYNPLGQMVRELRVKNDELKDVRMNVADLPSGLYYLSVQGHGWMKSEKVVVNRN